MELDTSKIDDAVLALLYLGLHDGARAWKGFDWDAMNRLHEKGYITDPHETLQQTGATVLARRGVEARPAAPAGERAVRPSRT
jgi:hypothetical protein